MVHPITKLSKYLWAVGAFVMINLGGCYYDVEEVLYPEVAICDTANVSYTNFIAPLLQNNCLSCHSQAAAFGGVVLEGHSYARQYADNGRLLGALRHANGFSPMPQGAPKLPACNIEKVAAWAANGAPDN